MSRVLVACEFQIVHEAGTPEGTLEAVRSSVVGFLAGEGDPDALSEHLKRGREARHAEEET